MAFAGILIAIVGHLLNGTVSIFDKFLLKSQLKPVVFAFWIMLTSLGAFLLLPFDFNIPSSSYLWLLDLLAGATFILGVFLMYEALVKEEVSRVLPIIGGLIPAFTYIFYLLFGQGEFSLTQIFALVVIGLSVVVLTYHHSEKRINFWVLSAAPLAALLFALSSVLIKQVFESQGFISGLAFSRLGGLIILPFVLIDSESRREIFKKREMPQKGNLALFFLGRIFSGSGFLMVNISYLILSPVVVNALQSVQYAYLFLANLTLGRFWPKIFCEQIHRKTFYFKLAGFLGVIIGLILLIK